MAGITGVLNADFRSFLDAVAKAEVSLKGFESGSEKVQSALNRMANSFSGQKVIQDATQMTKAIDSMGGASTLTSSEMVKVNATVTEAIAKYKALGVSAPPAMQDLANATKSTATASGGFMDTLGKMNGLLGTLGIGLSVGALVSFGKALLSDADQLVKLHDKTAITLQDLQRMQIAGDDAGVSLESMTDAVNKLQKNLGSDNDGANAALRRLGLNLDDIRVLTPENQFYAIAAAIRAVKDPAEQVALAVALFGKAGAEMLPVIKRGFDDLRGAAVGMSDETIKNLDLVGDTFSRLYRTSKGVIANMLVSVFEPANTGYRGMVSSTKDAQAAAEKLAPAMAKAIPRQVIVDVREFDRAMEGSNKTISEAASKLKSHQDALAAVNLKIADATRDTGHLTDAQKLLVDKYTALGLSNEDISTKLGISSLAIQDFKNDTKLAADRLNDFIDGMQRARENAEKLAPKLGGLGFKMLHQDITLLKEPVKEFYDGLGKTETTLSALITGSLTKMPDVVAGGTKAIEDATSAADEGTKATNDWGGALSTLSNDFVQMAQIGGDSFGEVGRVVGTVIKAVEMAQKATDAFQAAAKSAAGASAADYASLATSYIGVGIAIAQMVNAYKDAKDAAETLRIETHHLDTQQKFWNTDIQFTHALYEAMKTPAGALVKEIEELGGVAALSADQMKILGDRLQTALFNRNGAAQTKKSMAELNALLAEMGQVAIDAGKLVDQTFLDLIKQAKDLGVEVAGVNELLLTQLGGAAEGLNALLTGLSKGLGDSFTVTAEQGAGLAAAVAGDFAEMIDRGMSFKDALDKLKPSIDILTDTLKKSGVDGGAAFSFLTEMSRIAGDAIMGPLSDAITGANKALKGLHNSGILNQTMFTGLEQSAMQAYQKIIDGGGDGNAALMMLQPTLQTLWAMQKDFGYEVDAATQALLDEAEATGKVGDKHRPIAEQMLLATNKIAAAVEGLARVFGVVLPSAIDETAKTLDATDWESWRDRGVDAAHDVEEAVDAVSFGHSPGGLKEIPILLAASSDALVQFARDFTSGMADAYGAVQSVNAPLDALKTRLDNEAKLLGLTGIDKTLESLSQKEAAEKDSVKTVAEYTAEYTRKLASLQGSYDRTIISNARSRASEIKALGIDATAAEIKAVDDKYASMESASAEHFRLEVQGIGQLVDAYESSYGEIMTLIDAKYDAESMAAQESVRVVIEAEAKKVQAIMDAAKKAADIDASLESRASKLGIKSNAVLQKEARDAVQLYGDLAIAATQGLFSLESVATAWEKVVKAYELIGTHPMEAMNNFKPTAYAATGGYVTDRGIQHFAGGGAVLNFRPRGTDTVPAMLTPGEMVLTPGQQQRLLGGGGQSFEALETEVKGLRADMRAFQRDSLRAATVAATSAVLRKRRVA